MNHYRAFEVEYLGATDTKGARVKIRDLRFRKSIFIPKKYDDSFDATALQIATEHLSREGMDVLGYAQNGTKHIIFCNNFLKQLS